jgi:hypothetical protein
MLEIDVIFSRGDFISSGESYRREAIVFAGL